MAESFKTNTTRIAQICYKDEATDSWIPVTTTSPLPVTGGGGGGSVEGTIRVIGDSGEAVDVVQLPDGSYALVSQSQLTFRNISTQQPIYVSEDNPLPTSPSLTLGGTVVKNAVDTSSYNLQSAPYIVSTNINTDYILDNIELKFSTNETKTITITSDSSAVLWGGTLNTSPSNAGYNTTGRHFQLSFNQAFNAHENININVTQTTNACLLDCVVRIKTGVDSLMGNPSAAVYMIDPLGNPYGVKHIQNRIRTSSVDYTYDIAAGNIPNHSNFRGFGERENIAIAVTGTDVWKGTESSIPIPTITGEQLSVVSTSIQDSSSGTGVQKVSIHYLDTDGYEGTEEVFLNGTTPVNLTYPTVSFVNDFHATAVGSNTVAVGTIDIYRTSDVTRIYSSIYVGGNFALTCSKKVPIGKRFFLTEFTATVTGNKPTSVRLRSTDHGLNELYNSSNPVFLFKDSVFLETGSIAKVYNPPIPIPSGSIIKVTSWTAQAGANSSAGFNGWLE